MDLSLRSFCVVFCLSFGTLKLFKNNTPIDSLILTAGWFIIVAYGITLLYQWIESFMPKEKVDPRGKVVLITGCDTGFGFSLAERLASSGFTVFAGCLNEDGEGAQTLKNSNPNLHVVPLDVTKHEDVQALVKDIEARLGDQELWALVNNAGVAIFSEFEWCSMSIIEHMFKVNVLGAMRVTKSFLPLIRKSKGRVIIVASVAGHITYPGFLTYSMTKHALVSFGDGLRREMRKWGIPVSVIEPSMYRTRISESDVLTGALENSWERTPEAIKEAYGFPYYKDFKTKMQKIAKQARPYLEEVVDCMERAVVDSKPVPTYRCGGPADKIRLWIMSMLPVSVLDFVICHVIQPSYRQLSQGGKSPKVSESS